MTTVDLNTAHWEAEVAQATQPRLVRKRKHLRIAGALTILLTAIVFDFGPHSWMARTIVTGGLVFVNIWWITRAVEQELAAAKQAMQHQMLIETIDEGTGKVTESIGETNESVKLVRRRVQRIRELIGPDKKKRPK